MTIDPADCDDKDPIEKHLQTEAEAFIDQSMYALKYLYKVLPLQIKALEDISKKIKDLEQQEQIQHLIFQERDQWSPSANHLYIRYWERVNAIVKGKKALLTDPSNTDELRRLLARIGATEVSMSVLGGAILQIAKQALSFRFGSKPNLSGARLVGSQSIIEIIWEGRNHAAHWEERNPKLPVKNMLIKLQNELSIPIQTDKNNSLNIIYALGWKTVDNVVSDLKALVK